MPTNANAITCLEIMTYRREELAGDWVHSWAPGAQARNGEPDTQIARIGRAVKCRRNADLASRAKVTWNEASRGLVKSLFLTFRRAGGLVRQSTSPLGQVGGRREREHCKIPRGRSGLRHIRVRGSGCRFASPRSHGRRHLRSDRYDVGSSRWTTASCSNRSHCEVVGSRYLPVAGDCWIERNGVGGPSGEEWERRPALDLVATHPLRPFDWSVGG